MATRDKRFESDLQDLEHLCGELLTLSHDGKIELDDRKDGYVPELAKIISRTDELCSLMLTFHRKNAMQRV